MGKKASVLYLIIVSSICCCIEYTIDIRKVSGNSMYPALYDGQYIIIWKLAYGIMLPYKNTYLLRWKKPKKNDIVCYLLNGQYVVKRCAAIGGQNLNFSRTHQRSAQHYGLLQLDVKSVPLTVNQFQNLGGFLPADQQKIPDNFILALGDNSTHSYDSRDYGFVAIDSIYGKLLWN